MSELRATIVDDPETQINQNYDQGALLGGLSLKPSRRPSRRVVRTGLAVVTTAAALLAAGCSGSETDPVPSAAAGSPHSSSPEPSSAPRPAGAANTSPEYNNGQLTCDVEGPGNEEVFAIYPAQGDYENNELTLTDQHRNKLGELELRYNGKSGADSTVSPSIHYPAPQGTEYFGKFTGNAPQILTYEPADSNMPQRTITVRVIDMPPGGMVTPQTPQVTAEAICITNPRLPNY